MISASMWLAGVVFVFSILILMASVNNMILRKSIKDFLPFFSLGIALSLYVGALAFEVFFGALWMLLEVIILLSLTWIFLKIRRENG